MNQPRRGIRAVAALLIAGMLALLLPQMAMAEGYSAVVTVKSVPVYRDRQMTDQAGTLKKASVVRVEEETDSVVRFAFKGQGEYYCAADALTPVEEIGVPAYVKSTGAKAYEKADTSSKSVPAEQGLAVNALAVSGSWALAEVNGYGVYMKKADLALAEQSSILETGVVSVKDASRIPCEVKVDELDAYPLPDRNTTKLGTLRKGDRVTVLDYNSEWAHIAAGGATGYCATSGLKPANDVSGEFDNAKSVNIAAVVEASSVKVYREPDSTLDPMCTLKNGTEVNVIAFNTKWAYVEKNGYYGYCATSALKKAGSASVSASSGADEKYLKKYPTVQFTGTVVYENAPVYSASNPSTPFSRLPIATQVDVYAMSSKWTYLGIGSSRGFVETKYISRAEYAPILPGNTGNSVKNMQAALEKLGYFDALPDGTYGDATGAAVKRFQSCIGVSQTGDADLITLRVLGGGYAPESPLLSASLKQGADNDNVKRVQTRLKALGYFSKASSVDGGYGAITVIAVRMFQSEAGLSPDGQCGYDTLRALYSNGAPRLSGGNPADYTNTPSSSYGVTTMPEDLKSTQSVLPENATRVERIEYVIYIAQNQLGKPYVYGTAGPSSFDCSGLTTYCFKKIGITLGRSAYAHGYEENTGTKITSVSDLKRGDILCFNTISDSDLSDHVGIYLGNGYFIHASSGDSNGHQVVVSSLSTGYYSTAFSWARRPAY